MKRAFVLGGVVVLFALLLGLAVYAGVPAFGGNAAGSETEGSAANAGGMPDVAQNSLMAMVLEVRSHSLMVYLYEGVSAGTLCTVALPEEPGDYQAGQLVEVAHSGVMQTSYPAHYPLVEAIDVVGQADESLQEEANEAYVRLVNELLPGTAENAPQAELEIQYISPSQLEGVLEQTPPAE